MTLKQIFPRVYEHKLGPVNVWFIVDDDGVTLVDTCYVNKEQQVLAPLSELGKTPADVKRILLTHCHPDHAGSLAAIKKITGAPAMMHAVDAGVVRGAVPLGQPPKPSPGLMNAVLYRVFIAASPAVVPPAEIEREVADGEVLPISGGVRVMHTPGHSPGHVAYLLERDGGLLFAGDVCSNMPSLGYSIVYDDFEQGKRTLARLSGVNAATVCYGHGGPTTGAAFRAKWSR